MEKFTISRVPQSAERKISLGILAAIPSSTHPDPELKLGAKSKSPPG
jgi:hypothetical protein